MFFQTLCPIFVFNIMIIMKKVGGKREGSGRKKIHGGLKRQIIVSDEEHAYIVKRLTNFRKKQDLHPSNKLFDGSFFIPYFINKAYPDMQQTGVVRKIELSMVSAFKNNNAFDFIHINDEGYFMFEMNEITALCIIGYASIIDDFIIEVCNDIFERKLHANKGTWGEKSTYLMKDEHTGLVKIGRSIHPSSREKTLQGQIPKLRLIAIHPKDIEKELHNIYSHANVRGEWFSLSDNEVSDIIEEFAFNHSSI